MSGGINPEKGEKQEIIQSLTNPSCHSEQPAPCSRSSRPREFSFGMVMRVSLKAVRHSSPLSFPSHSVTVQLLGWPHPCSRVHRTTEPLELEKTWGLPAFPFPSMGLRSLHADLSSRSWVPASASLQGRCEVTPHVQLPGGTGKEPGKHAGAPQRRGGGTAQGWDTPWLWLIQ